MVVVVSGGDELNKLAEMHRVWTTDFDGARDENANGIGVLGWLDVCVVEAVVVETEVEESKRGVRRQLLVTNIQKASCKLVHDSSLTNGFDFVLHCSKALDLFDNLRPPNDLISLKSHHALWSL